MSPVKTVAGVILFVFISIIAGCGQDSTTDKAGAGANRDSSPDAGASLRKPKSGTKSPTVQIIDAPNNGIQPQASIDDTGTIHLIYFKGNPASGDIFYVRKTSQEAAFSRPLLVNSKPGSVVAIGNVRGAHLTLGKNKRPHVAWMGSQKTKSPQTNNQSPMLYARLTEEGDRFEAERNVIQKAYGLDGGGSVAADDKGNVYVLWHAPAPGKEGEENRRVWVAHSKDEGKTFAAEKPAFDQQTGACGCCGMRAHVDARGALHVLYRSATKQINRDIFLLRSTSPGEVFEGVRLDTWPIAACPMSTMSFGAHQNTTLAAWETRGQVYFAWVDPQTGKTSRPVAAPGKGKNRKHPVVAISSRGDVLLAWTEGMGWKRGGTLAWQIFDTDGKPTKVKGQARGAPAWSLITAVPLDSGDFVIIR